MMTSTRKCPREHCGGTLLYVDYEAGERYFSCHLCGRSVEQSSTRRSVKDASNNAREGTDSSGSARQNPSSYAWAYARSRTFLST